MTGARRELRVDGASVAFREAGRGTPLVLVHGAASRGAVWEPQLTGLADVARLVAPDLPGHGGSGGPGRTRVDEYAGWVVAFLDAAGLDSVVLAGHSMGGAIVQTVTLGDPGRVRALVLVGTAGRLSVPSRLLDLLRAGGSAGPDLVTGLAYSPATPPARVAEATRATSETPLRVTLGDFVACDRFDAMAELPRLRLPTLVVVGRDDRLTPPPLAAALAGAIPGARLTEIEAAGHFPQLEQPEAVNAAIRTFLRGQAFHP